MQADLLTLVSLGCHPLGVVTAVTVQDTTGVESLHPLDPELVERQARLILEDSPVHAIKIGLLGSVENLVRVAEIISDYPQIPVVLDPVLASGRGDELSSEELIAAMRDLLLPQTTVLTPNTIEARRLAFDSDELEDDEDGAMADGDGQNDLPDTAGSRGDMMPDEMPVFRQPLKGFHLGPAETEPVESPDLMAGPKAVRRQASREDDEPELAECAAQLLSLGVQYVLITGTHNTRTPEVVNMLYDENGLVHVDHWPRLPGSYHGSGCTLASAIAAALAFDSEIQEAVHEAQEYTWQTLSHALRPGMGQFIPDRLFWARNDETANDQTANDETVNQDQDGTAPASAAECGSEGKSTDA